jgi:hypothetical protein
MNRLRSIKKLPEEESVKELANTGSIYTDAAQLIARNGEREKKRAKIHNYKILTAF